MINKFHRIYLTKEGIPRIYIGKKIKGKNDLPTLNKTKKS